MASRNSSRNTEHPLYATWINMRQRCKNPKNTHYKYYGARGIKVCERWNSFRTFVADIGPKPEGHTLDRKDNDGDYEPSNCKWSTLSEQRQNQSGRKVSRTGERCIYHHKQGYKAEPMGVYVGYFKTIEEAVAARDEYLRSL